MRRVSGGAIERRAEARYNGSGEGWNMNPEQERIQTEEEKKIDEAAREILEKFRAAFEELAK